jgi:hypothetical protein
MSKYLPSILASAYAANVPLLLWGPPGVGKTARIEGFGATNGIMVETIIASIREPADFAGYPVPHGGKLSMLPPAFAQRLSGANEGILFIDELTTAPPAVQAACLRVIHGGAIGDLMLPRGIRRWAAANPPEQAADGSALAAPLANRFMHVEVDTSAAEWVSGAMNGWVGGSYAPPPTGWEGKVPQAMALVAAYIQRRPTALRVMPKDAAAQGKAWASPRTWEMAARMLAVCDAMSLGDDTMMLCIGGCIGDAAAAEFLAWRKRQDLPDPEALLATGQWTVPGDGSVAFTIMGSIVAAVCANPTRDRWVKGWELLALAAQRHADLAALTGRSMAQGCMTHRFPPPPGMVAMAPLLKAIGGFGK